MTVYAYRDGILASDSLISRNGTVLGTMPKSMKSKDGWLAAGEGRASSISKFFKWVEDGRDEDEFVKLEDFGGLLVSPEGVVYVVEEDLSPYKINKEFHSGGSGSDIAIGAMAMGATAVQAVEAAIKHDTGCGGPVQAFKLGDKK